MGRRKNVSPTPSAEMDKSLRAKAKAFSKSAESYEVARKDRNSGWYQAYHTFGYTQAQIAWLHNDKLGESDTARVTEAAVEKALTRMS